jgi:hypothetical protein
MDINHRLLDTIKSRNSLPPAPHNFVVPDLKGPSYDR